MPKTYTFYQLEELRSGNRDYTPVVELTQSRERAAARAAHKRAIDTGRPVRVVRRSTWGRDVVVFHAEYNKAAKRVLCAELWRPIVK